MNHQDHPNSPSNEHQKKKVPNNNEGAKSSSFEGKSHKDKSQNKGKPQNKSTSHVIKGKPHKSGMKIPRWLKLGLIMMAMTCVVFIISGVLLMKTSERNQLDLNLTERTAANVGGAVMQFAPSLNALQSESMLYKSLSDEMQVEEGYGLTREIAEVYVENTNLVSTDGNVVIYLDLKKRGLRYEPTYQTEFTAVYVLSNTSDEEVAVEFEFPFPESVLSKEINNARLFVDGEEQENPVRREEVTDDLYRYEYEYDYDYGYDYYDDDYNYGYNPQETESYKSGLYWEGTIEAEGGREIEVMYNTVGLGQFSYVGIENPEGSQDLSFDVKILGSRKYDNSGSLTIDEKEYITEGDQNGVILSWIKPSLFSSPDIEISVATRVNPSQHLSAIYTIMVPLYLGFAVALILLVTLFKKEFGGIDMVLISLLFTIFFPFLHYLVSFNVDPSADVLSGYSGVVDFSMPLYGAFAIALSIIGGLMLYLLAKVSGAKFSFGVGLPLIIVFMVFFPLAMTLPEYRYLLVLIGMVAILAVLVQMRVSRKLTRVET